MSRTKKSNSHLVKLLTDFSNSAGPPVEEKEIVAAAGKGEFAPLTAKLLKLPDSVLSAPLRALLILVIQNQWPTPPKAKHRPSKDRSEDRAVTLYFLGRLIDNPNRKAALQDTAVHFKRHRRTIERAIEAAHKHKPMDKK
jgi:hypothetical protein